MTLVAKVAKRDDGRVEIRSPGVGLWREAPERGALVYPGARLGRLEVLGELTVIVAPNGAHGVVVDDGEDTTRARRPVAHDEPLLLLDPEIASGAAAQDAEAAEAGGDLVFRAPTSGRFYARPAPDKPLFVAVGDTIAVGQTVAILEVMKTFNRVQYGGPGVPAKARVIRIVPEDGADLGAGDPLLEVEAV